MASKTLKKNPNKIINKSPGKQIQSNVAELQSNQSHSSMTSVSEEDDDSEEEADKVVSNPINPSYNTKTATSLYSGGR